MTIIRDGKKIVLTDEELLAIRKEEHAKDVEYDVEQEVLAWLENEWISFEDWSETGQEYSSPEDAMHDFIAKIAEDILEKEELYERDPNGYKSDISSIVSDYADDFGYRKDE